MYKFTYFDDRVKLMISDRKTFWDLELKNELSPVLEELKRSGEITGASFGIKPGITGLVYELKGRTFQITYSVDAVHREVRFYEFQQVSHEIDYKISLEQNLRDGDQQPIYIPQIDDPYKFIKTVELIDAGVNTSVDLANALGSNAKKSKDLARRGDYLGRAVMEIGLADRHKHDQQSSSIYILKERGRLIARSKDSETQKRLLVEALLGFLPIQLIIYETDVKRGNRELTKELIKEIISMTSLGDCGGVTESRRASSLRELINWVARWAGIPIRRAGKDGTQLYIPYIYDDRPVQL